MKEFDWQQAKQGKKVITRRGEDVRIICYDAKDPVRPIIALVTVQDPEAPFGEPRYIEEVRKYAPNGKTSSEFPPDDLVMASERKTGWVNIYKEPGGDRSAIGVYPTDQEAVDDAFKGEEKAIATVKIEWEE